MKNLSIPKVTLRIAMVALAVLLAGSLDQRAFAVEAPNSYALVQRTIDGYVLPHFASLRSEAEMLPLSLEQVCTTTADAPREELTTHFHRTVEAFAGIEFLRFGPLVEQGRRERLSYWPDPRGAVARQFRIVLANKDLAIADAASISKQSAAVQGLPALEILLLDKGAPLGPGENSAFRCALAKAIAQNIANTARDLEDGWIKDGGWRDKMLRPGSDNDTYKEPGEAASEFVKALLVGFQLIGDVQIKPRLETKTKSEDSEGHVQKIGPYEKSGLVEAYYAASVSALQDFYEILALETYLPEEQDWVKNWAGGAWRTMHASDGVGGRVPNANREDKPSLRELFDKIGGLRKLVSREMAASAGLTVGFNELDGD